MIKRTNALTLSDSLLEAEHSFLSALKQYLMYHRGAYLVIEGVDLTGKDSQCQRICQLIERANIQPHFVTEPGTTKLGQAIRRQVKDKNSHLSPWQNVKLFTIARCDLYNRVILPAMGQGCVIVASRNWWSTIAYQGYGQGVELDRILELSHKALSMRYLKPTAGVILLASAEARRQRRIARDKMLLGGKKPVLHEDAFEDSDDHTLMDKALAGYRQLAGKYHIPIINASVGQDAVYVATLIRLTETLKQKL